MAIRSFREEYYFLSSMFPLPQGVEGPRGIVVPTVEHAYQAEKFEQPEPQDLVMAAPTGFKAKRIANRFERKKIALIRPDWELVKVDVMRGYVRQKFERDEELAGLLLATGTEELIEGNDRGDDFWGVCPADSDNGLNWLGRILMETRELIQLEVIPPDGPSQLAS